LIVAQRQSKKAATNKILAKRENQHDHRLATGRRFTFRTPLRSIQVVALHAGPPRHLNGSPGHANRVVGKLPRGRCSDVGHDLANGVSDCLRDGGSVGITVPSRIWLEFVWRNLRDDEVI
jgi:hypothetical protein